MKHLAFTLSMAVALCASRADSQTFVPLVQFSGISGAAIGAKPLGSLTLSNTTLYGMTSGGGTNGNGTIFSLGINGTDFQSLVSFTGDSGAAIGAAPRGDLTLSGTSLYGMTLSGGTNNDGSIFSVGANGTNYQSLLSFTGTSGAAIGRDPFGSLAVGNTGLYGMTFGGIVGPFVGNVFSVGFGGMNYQSLVSFTGTGGTAIGAHPNGSLTVSVNGTTLYGMTLAGGANGDGNIFSVGANGANYQNLITFTGTGGTASGGGGVGSLTLSNTTLYGMTLTGGSNGDGNIFSVGTNGMNYRNLLSFTGSGSGTANGFSPFGSLILSGTTLYGMTLSGGTDGLGNIFSVGFDGTGFQDLYDFTGGNDGGAPEGDLTLSSGTLFGMTSQNGANGDGTVFALVLPTPAPEPGTLALAAVFAVAVVSYRWRRTRLRRGNTG